MSKSRAYIQSRCSVHSAARVFKSLYSGGSSPAASNDSWTEARIATRRHLERSWRSPARLNQYHSLGFSSRNRQSAWANDTVAARRGIGITYIKRSTLSPFVSCSLVPSFSCSFCCHVPGCLRVRTGHGVVYNKLMGERALQEAYLGGTRVSFEGAVEYVLGHEHAL